MRKSKSSNPSSVVHYTSLEVVNILLNNIYEDENKKPFLIMHLSHLTMMNDLNEGRLILDKFFTDSEKKKNLKQEWNEKYASKEEPFILSTISTDNNTKNIGSLPMWKMYGDDCKGAFLRFDKKGLLDYCNANGYIFDKCNYLSSKEINEKVKNFNINGSFDVIYKDSAFAKNLCWKHEKEWRLLKKAPSTEIKFKYTSRGIVEYVELKMPLKLLKEICIGPLANNEIVLQSLNLMKQQLVSKYPSDIVFKISKSKILMRE